MADFTNKLRLAFAIRFFAVTARATGLAGVGSGNGDDSNAFALRLIFDKVSELRECPIGLSGSLAFPNRRPLAYPFEVFNSDSLIRAFSLPDKLFRDAMIFIGLIATLFAAHLFEFTVSRASADLLHLAALLQVGLTFVFYGLTGEDMSGAVGGNLNHAKINTYRVLNLFCGWLLNLAHRKQEEIAFPINKVGFAVTVFKQLLLTFAANLRNQLTPRYRPDIDGLLLSFPSQDAVIVSHRAQRFEASKRSFVQLVSIGNFGNRSDDDLSRQTGRFSNLRVVGLVNRIRCKDLRNESKFTDQVTSFVCLRSLACSFVGLSLTCAINFIIRI
jgi:hypothetical protein